jgi:hypothetical protein
MRFLNFTDIDMVSKHKMTKEEHRKRHIKLHHCLDELIADFIWQTEGLPSNTTLMQLMKWSHNQTINPTTKKG